MAATGNLGGEIPVVDDVLSSHEQQIYPSTSLEENSIEFEFQTDRNYYVGLHQSYLAPKVKLVKERGYDTHKSKEAKREHKNEEQPTKAAANDEEDDTNSVPLLTYVHNITHSVFSNKEVYIKNQQIYNSNGLDAHKSYISNNFKGAICEYKGVLHCDGYDFEANPDDIQDSPLSDPFFSRRLKMLLGSDGFTLNGKLGVDFFTTSEILYPNKKVIIRFIRPRLIFYMISDNPNISLGIVDCSLYTRRIGLKEDYHKKRMDMLAYAPVKDNYIETLAKTLVIPSSQNQLIQGIFFNNAPIRRIAIAKKTDSAFTGSFTKNPFCINNSIPDKLEYSGEDNQL